MTKLEYKLKLLRRGYKFEGDIAILDTPYGIWKSKITKCLDGYGLVSLNNPIDNVGGVK